MMNPSFQSKELLSMERNICSRASAFILPVLILLLTGCQVTPTPPAFSLYGHKGIILLPFDNLSQDGALGQEVQDGVTSQLVALNAAPVFEEGPVSDYLNSLKGNDTDPRSNPTVMKKLAKRFKGDLLMTCNVESYTESIQDQPPQRVMVDYKTKAYKWGYSTVQQVKVTATARLIDVASGNIAWMKQAYGAGQVQNWNDLPYPGEKEYAPGEGWDTWRKRSKDHGDDDHGDRQGDERDGKARKDRAYDRNDDQGRQNGDRRDDGRGGYNNGPSNTVVNVTIQNNNTNSQQQNQTANATANADASTGSPSAAPAPLLYQTNATVANLRQAAIARTVGWLTDDFRGHGGWYPGYVAPPPK
jgi:hypothetical protein